MQSSDIAKLNHVKKTQKSKFIDAIVSDFTQNENQVSKEQSILNDLAKINFKDFEKDLKLNNSDCQNYSEIES